jgi:hypothetical protein
MHANMATQTKNSKVNRGHSAAATRARGHTQPTCQRPTAAGKSHPKKRLLAKTKEIAQTNRALSEAKIREQQYRYLYD